MGWSTGLSWSGWGRGVVPGGVVDGSVMEWSVIVDREGGSTWWGGRRVCHGVDRGGRTWWGGLWVCRGVDRGG